MGLTEKRKYIGANRKEISLEECVFCKIILDIEPVNVGHVLILPKIHKDSIDDIPLNFFM